MRLIYLRALVQSVHNVTEEGITTMCAAGGAAYKWIDRQQRAWKTPAQVFATLAMWLVLDDLPRGYWEHRGISKPFALGQRQTPTHPIEREVVKAMRRLYEDRLEADYQAVRLTALESTTGLTTARQVLRLVAGTRGLSLGGIIP